MRILILSAFIILSFKSFTQRKIIGKVIDSETSGPIKNVRIFINDDKRATITNHLGFFELSIDNTIRKIRTEHISYGAVDVNVPGQDKFTIALTKGFFEVPPIDLNKPADSSHENLSDSTGMSRPVDFKGGRLAMIRYLQANIEIPEAIEANFIRFDSACSSTLLFIVTKTGQVKNATIAGDTLSGMGNIILTALNKMTWKPAIQNGDACDQKVRLKLSYGVPVFALVDDMAVFADAKYSGDLAPYYKYISKNLIYPKAAKRAGIQGSVFVSFVIDKKGEVLRDRIQVVKGLGYGTNEEAIRLIANLPKFIPATHRTKPVYLRMVLPVAFKQQQ